MAILQWNDIYVAFTKEGLPPERIAQLFRAGGNTGRCIGGKTTDNTKSGRSGRSDCWLWFCRNLCLSGYLPVAAIAAILKAGYYLTEMGLMAILTNDTILHIDNKVHMLGHDDIILDLNDRIVL